MKREIRHYDTPLLRMPEISFLRLKEKILRHGRTFHAQGEDSVSIYFFPSEVIPLLKILALIFSVQMPAEKDNYPMIGRANRKENQFLHVQPQLEDLIA